MTGSSHDFNGNLSLQFYNASDEDIKAFRQLMRKGNIRIIGRDIEYMRAYDELEKEFSVTLD